MTERRGPLIVDDETGIPPEAIVSANSQSGSPGGYEGLVSSMSGYPKQEIFDYGSATTRPNQASAYPSYGQPTFDAQYMNTHAQVPSGLPNTAEMPLLSGDQYDAHDAYTQQSSSYQSFTPRPEVTNFAPNQGPAGRKLFVYLNAPQALETSNSLPTVLFGSRRCSGMLSKLSGPNQPGNYTIAVDIPAFESTGASSTNVTLSLDTNDEPGATMPVAFGTFNYTDATSYMSSPTPSLSRKRKLSPEHVGNDSPGKRLNTNLRAGEFDNVTSSPMSNNTLSPYSNPQQPVNNYAYAHTPTRPQTYQSPQQQNVPRYGASPVSAHSHLSVQPPEYQGFTGYIQERPGVSTSMAGHLPSSTGYAAPTLVRTSTLQDSAPGMAPASFYAGAMYTNTNKAILKLDGDLNSMAENWTQDEITAHRRLVRFRRSQNGSTINATFEPVTPEDHARAPGNIYVNCIWWKEKQACYITSVDTIQLLESLVAVRFTVEEKNRIRRNLEGFRPMTVSKTRTECEEFFKIIMGFPSPKPRNIEKDVKVFPWRILSHALKKIIGKYSATFSSPAASLPSSMPSIGGPANASRSPQPAATNSSAMMHYPAHTMAPTTLTSQPMMAVSSAPPATMSQGVSWHQPTTTGYMSGDTASSRPSFDFTNFLDNGNPMSMGGAGGRHERIPSISQSLGYNYGMPDFNSRGQS
ncbi:hypothetical protein CAC42_5002 [Sphaceloma murrayae]|uniref:DUF7082 domain-containing protein n=1 Tax=Sphaceloma murrayae TaxID=2082308 RepID=A0A2K1QPL2_9PEZI|nr:hypothetical protein CAC42_5002 [Sphaceloma murrayae]